jgi:hypothetical protein
MGSTARWCGVYGGEYAPTGLRMFAWWKKNGKKRGFRNRAAAPRELGHPNCPTSVPFICVVRLEQGLGQNVFTRALDPSSAN